MSRCSVESELLQVFILQGILRMLQSIRAARQPEIFQKTKFTFPKTKNYTGKRLKMFFWPSTLAAGCTTSYSGSPPDLKLFGKNKTFHKEASKRYWNLEYSDNGVLQQCSSDYWAVLADRWFFNAAKHLRAAYFTCFLASETPRVSQTGKGWKLLSDCNIAETVLGTWIVL